MASVLRKDKQISVLHHLVEGNTIRSSERLTDVHRDTIMRLLVRFGGKIQAMMDQRLFLPVLDVNTCVPAFLAFDSVWRLVRIGNPTPYCLGMHAIRLRDL